MRAELTRQSFCDNDPARLASIRVRFASPVMPGDTLMTKMWKDGDSVYFQTLVKGTGKPALANAVAKLRACPPLRRLTHGPGPAKAAAPSGGPTPALTSAPVFEQMAETIKRNPALVDKVKAVFQFHITKDGSAFSRALPQCSRP